MGIRKEQFYYTERMLYNAFLMLLKSKDITKISVTDVCKAAGANRGTFYLHFMDINDLIDKLNSSFLQQVQNDYAEGIDCLFLGDVEKYQKSTLHTLQVIASWPEFSTTMVGSNSRGVFSDQCIQFAQDIFRKKLDEYNITENRESYIYEFIYYLNGCWGVIKYWCENGLSEKPEIILSYLEKFYLAE